jgi:hypothetical protein
MPRSVICECVNCDLPCSKRGDGTILAAGQPNSPAGTPVQDAVADLNFCLQFSGVPQTVRDLIIRARNAVITQQRLA